MFYEECTLEEILAYRELEKETFDFGEGPMRIEGWYGSEDAYYEMFLENQKKEKVEKITEKITEKQKSRKNKRRKRRKDSRRKNNLDRLKKAYPWGVLDMETYKKRIYYSSRKKVAKRNSNKKVRKYRGAINDGSHYKKIYDYWWEVF
jgi:hypothetical protein